MDEHEAKRSRVSTGESSSAHPIPSSSIEGDNGLHLKLLTQIQELDKSKYFHELDQSSMSEYRKYVKQPISFADIRAKITDNGYESHAKFISDVELVFGNAIAFYGEKDPQFSAALELRQDWENMLIEADLIEGDADIYVSTDFDGIEEEEEEIDEADMGEDFQSMQAKMLEEATMPLTDVIDRMAKESGEVKAPSNARVEEMESSDDVDELPSDMSSSEESDYSDASEE